MIKVKYKKINNLAELTEALKGKTEYQEFVIALNGGMVSRKEIMLDEETGKFLINNCIDDSEQELTAKELFKKDYTNIGQAIRKGAFFQVV